MSQAGIPIISPAAKFFGWLGGSGDQAPTPQAPPPTPTPANSAAQIGQAENQADQMTARGQAANIFAGAGAAGALSSQVPVARNVLLGV